MSHQCKCGETFSTLSAYRIHQRDECQFSADEIDMRDQDTEEVSQRLVDELLICDMCGEKNDEAESISQDITDAGLAFTLGFQCSHCGATNENTGIVK